MKSKNLIFILSTVTYLAGLAVGYFVDFHTFRGQLTVFTNGTLYTLSFDKIIKNNISVIIHEIFGGILLLPTINSLFFSGFTIGLTLKSLVIIGIGFKNALLLIIPHCIFEIPAIIIAGAAGFKIPYVRNCKVFSR